MSAFDDLLAALLADAALTAEVGARIREDIGSADDDYPFVVIKQTGKESPRGLDGTRLARIDDFQVESWGTTRTDSAAIHDLVEEALMAADIECDPAEPNAIDPEVWARACIWNVRIITPL